MLVIINNIISFAYILGCLPLAQILFREQEIQRKFVHVMLCNWWFLCVFLFDNWMDAAICPVIFILINYLVLTGKLSLKSLSSLIRENEKPIGTMIFPVSLFVLVVISYQIIKEPIIGGIGFVALGYGDAAAALVGMKYPIHPYKFFNNTKTLSGSSAMLLASFGGIFVYMMVCLKYLPIVALANALIISVVATACEAITPFGMDNLSVPVVTVFVFYIFLM